MNRGRRSLLLLILLESGLFVLRKVKEKMCDIKLGQTQLYGEAVKAVEGIVALMGFSEFPGQ